MAISADVQATDQFSTLHSPSVQRKLVAKLLLMVEVVVAKRTAMQMEVAAARQGMVRQMAMSNLSSALRHLVSSSITQIHSSSFHLRYISTTFDHWLLVTNGSDGTVLPHYNSYLR